MLATPIERNIQNQKNNTENKNKNNIIAFRKPLSKSFIWLVIWFVIRFVCFLCFVDVKST